MRYVATDSGIGRLVDEERVALLDLLPTETLAGFLGVGGRLGDLRTTPVRAEASISDLRLASVLSPGGVIYGVGLNYRSKQLATGREVPARPTLFVKSPSSLAAPGAPIVLPESAPGAVDFEGEIAVIVGDRLHDVRPDEAAGSITAFLAANDTTARDVMRATNNPTLAKSFPGFTQFGSFVAEPADYGGIGAVSLTTRVNGETRQDDRGEGMLLDAAELISLLSQYVELRPGDVVLTGTPAGTGEESGLYLQPGDVVEVQVADLPALVSHVTRSRVAVPVT